MAEKPPAKKRTASTKEEKVDGRVKPAHGGEGGNGDESLKKKVLEAALPGATFDGFSDTVLTRAGGKAGVEKTELARLFPEGPLSLIEYYSLWADAEMERRLAAMDLKQVKVRERIAAAVLARLSILK